MLKKGWIFFAVISLLKAESFVLITHPDSPIRSLNASEAKMIYLKQRRYWGEAKLTVLNLPPNNPLRNEMENQILHMTQEELDTYWMKQHYKGYRPPYRVESIESMILFVKKVEGSVGYIPKSRLEKGVKVIYESPES